MKKHSLFDQVSTIFKLDQTFKCFGPSNRYFSEGYPGMDKNFTKSYAERYGLPIILGTPIEGHALGFDDGQLLLSFSHNTPDNSLPIFWSDLNWHPFFKRYIKQNP